MLSLLDNLHKMFADFNFFSKLLIETKKLHREDAALESRNIHLPDCGSFLHASLSIDANPGKDLHVDVLYELMKTKQKFEKIPISRKNSLCVAH